MKKIINQANVSFLAADENIDSEAAEYGLTVLPKGGGFIAPIFFKGDVHKLYDAGIEEATEAECEALCMVLRGQYA